MKRFKKIISLMMAICMLCTCNAVAFAAEPATDTEYETQALTLHKVNGIYREDGSSGQYLTTITKACTTIKVMGNTYSSGTKYVTVAVYASSGAIVATGYNIPLNGSTYTPLTNNTFYTSSIPAGTYTVIVSSSDTKEYDVSTYFYY